MTVLPCLVDPGCTEDHLRMPLVDGQSTSAMLRDAEAELDRLREFVQLVALLDDAKVDTDGLVTRHDLAAAAREVLQ